MGKLSESRQVLQKVAASFNVFAGHTPTRRTAAAQHAGATGSLAAAAGGDSSAAPNRLAIPPFSPPAALGRAPRLSAGGEQQPLALAASHAAWSFGLTFLELALAGDAEKFVWAADLFRTAHHGFHVCLGAEHGDTLCVQRDLGVALLMMTTMTMRGKESEQTLREARERLRAAWQGLRECRGESSEDALAARGWLALAVARMRDDVKGGSHAEAARGVASDTRCAALAAFGPGHRATLTALTHEGYVLAETGDAAGALRALQEALEGLRGLYGDNHPRVQAVRSAMGRAMWPQGGEAAVRARARGPCGKLQLIPIVTSKIEAGRPAFEASRGAALCDLLLLFGLLSRAQDDSAQFVVGQSSSTATAGAGAFLHRRGGMPHSKSLSLLQGGRHRGSPSPSPGPAPGARGGGGRVILAPLSAPPSPLGPAAGAAASDGRRPSAAASILSSLATGGSGRGGRGAPPFRAATTSAAVPRTPGEAGGAWPQQRWTDGTEIPAQTGAHAESPGATAAAAWNAGARLAGLQPARATTGDERALYTPLTVGAPAMRQSASHDRLPTRGSRPSSFPLLPTTNEAGVASMPDVADATGGGGGFSPSSGAADYYGQSRPLVAAGQSVFSDPSLYGPASPPLSPVAAPSGGSSRILATRRVRSSADIHGHSGGGHRAALVPSIYINMPGDLVSPAARGEPVAGGAPPGWGLPATGAAAGGIRPQRASGGAGVPNKRSSWQSAHAPGDDPALLSPRRRLLTDFASNDGAPVGAAGASPRRALSPGIFSRSHAAEPSAGTRDSGTRDSGTRDWTRATVHFDGDEPGYYPAPLSTAEAIQRAGLMWDLGARCFCLLCRSSIIIYLSARLLVSLGAGRAAAGACLKRQPLRSVVTKTRELAHFALPECCSACRIRAFFPQQRCSA